LRTRSLLQPRIGAVLALVDPALRGDVESIHGFRVAARSLRAALRNLASRRRGALVRDNRKALQAAIRCLADPRDRDVGRALLTKRPVTSPDHVALRRRILGLCDSERRVALARAASRWPKDLDHLLARLLRRPEPSVDTVIRRTRAEAWQKRRSAISLARSLGRRFQPVRLHDLRRRVRSLRYALEALGEVDSTAHVRVTGLKPLQSALGDIQDRSVLAGWLEGQARRFRHTDPALAGALSEEARRYLAGSRKAHAALIRLRPARHLEQLALHVDPHAPDASRRRG
jgi:CHAD domain-containing protein